MNDPAGRFALIVPIITTIPIWVPWLVSVTIALGTAKMLDSVGLNPITFAKTKILKINKAKTPTKPGILQREVEKGQAPKEVDRVDKPHVHFKDGTAVNNDGTKHDKNHGLPNPSNNKKMVIF